MAVKRETPTKVITFRLDPETTAGEIFAKYESAGYSSRRIIEIALNALDGIEPEPIHDMNGATLGYLQEVVQRLEAVAKTLQDGGVLSVAQKETVQNALGPQFVDNMKRLVRPGFTGKPQESR